MNALKTIFKTYFGSLFFVSFYLWLIHDKLYENEVGLIIVVMIILNILLCTSYVLFILMPFGFIFKHKIATLNFKQAIHTFLFFFSLLPLFLFGINLIIGASNLKEGIEFSLLVLNLSSIIFMGFINFLKYKTLA